ncbi:hypothetical protein [Bacillus multifaciens]|uniref:hypothetical protein n=1 Tax=Bacillus multifaciens TaxID=3068506 RepID=UPI002740C4D1|nr:hypothetical protein [Bacillus sp. WLY-B-L8]MDP7981417.1 hypothetical protein [Bacillus sp. WLY-B-L8]
MDTQYDYKITYYLSNGEKIVGHLTISQTKEEYLKTLEDALMREEFLVFKNMGYIIQSKYLTHLRIEDDDTK